MNKGYRVGISEGDRWNEASPWENLANAIIVQAADDYRACRRKLKRCNEEEALTVKNEMKMIRHFFRSRWFEQLSEADGKVILAALDKEVLDIHGRTKVS